VNLNKLVESVSIVPVIEETFELERSGSRYLRGVKHDSLVISLEKNLFYWNSIGINGNALTWLTKIRGLSYRDALAALQKYSGIPFTQVLDVLDTPAPVYPKLLDVFYILGQQHRNYWYDRGFTDSTIDFFKLGYTGKAHVIPFFEDGVLVNFQCRRGKGNDKRVWNWVKGRKPTLYNIDNIKSNYTFLTEGSIDAITLHQMGISAITTNNIQYWDKRFNKHIIKFNSIYVLYDNDVAGKLQSSRVSRKLLNRAYVVFWPKHMPNKFDVNDAYLLFGSDGLKSVLNIMVEHSICSSDLHDASKRGKLYDVIDAIQDDISMTMKGTEYETSTFLPFG